MIAFLPLKIYLLFYAFECFAYLYACASGVCVCGAYRGQKRVPDALGLELCMVESHHLGAGELNLDPQEEQSVFVTTESSFFSQIIAFQNLLGIKIESKRKS